MAGTIPAVHRIRYAGTVDADGHILEPPDLWERYLEPKYRDRALRIRSDDEGFEYLEIGGKPSEMSKRGFPGTLGGMGKNVAEIRPSPERTYLAGAPFGSMDAAERLRLLDAEGLEAAFLYPTIGLLWEAELEEAELSQAYARAYNRWIVEFCAGSGGRLVPIAHLSLTDPVAAARELERAAREGARGAFVAPFTWTKKPHGHPDHDPVFVVAEALEIPFAIHPTFEPAWSISAQRFDGLRKARLLLSVTASDGVRHAFTTLFDFGVFDRFPRLKVVVLESGAGWIGYWLDRLDAVYAATFIGERVPLKEKPSAYFRRQCWISCDPDEKTVPALAELLGPDRFFWASDFPHADHTGNYLEELEEMVAGMPEDARSRILGGNVREAYGVG